MSGTTSVRNFAGFGPSMRCASPATFNVMQASPVVTGPHGVMVVVKGTRVGPAVLAEPVAWVCDVSLTDFSFGGWQETITAIARMSSTRLSANDRTMRTFIMISFSADVDGRGGFLSRQISRMTSAYGCACSVVRNALTMMVTVAPAGTVSNTTCSTLLLRSNAADPAATFP